MLLPFASLAAQEKPAAAPAPAIELGAPFADNAILQREMDLPVWGWSKPGTEVTVEFAGQKETAKVKEVLLEMMSWEKLKPDIIEVYGKNFTEKEANDIIAHMETPVGQLLVSKQAVMVGDVMAMSHEKMKNVMPKLMQIMQELGDKWIKEATK